MLTLLAQWLERPSHRVVNLEKIVIGLEKRLEQQQIEIYELREQRAMVGPGLSFLSSYAAVIRSPHRPLILVGLPARITPIRIKKLFYIVDFSRVKHVKGITAANPATLRKKVEQEI